MKGAHFTQTMGNNCKASCVGVIHVSLERKILNGKTEIVALAKDAADLPSRITATYLKGNNSISQRHISARVSVTARGGKLFIDIE